MSPTFMRRLTAPPDAWRFLAGCISVGLVGYFGPWLPHRAAGLVITGLDLAEYVKFLPQVASGQIEIRRELFYLPLLAGSIGACLLAGRRGLSPAERVVAGVMAGPIALAMLPPAWGPSTLLLPEFRLQVIAIALCWALLPGLALTHRLPDRAILAILAILSAIAGVLPAWGFWQVRPAILDLYRAAWPWGWGAWATVLGYLGASVIALIVLRRSKPPERS